MNKQVVASILSLISLAGVALYNVKPGQVSTGSEEFTNLLQKNIQQFAVEDAGCPVSPIIKVPAGYQAIHSSGIDGVDEKCHDFEKETLRLFARLDELLKSVGACKKALYHVHVAIDCPKKLDKFYELYAKYIEDGKPARTTIVVPVLPHKAQVKVTVTAYVKPE